MISIVFRIAWKLASSTDKTPLKRSPVDASLRAVRVQYNNLWHITQLFSRGILLYLCHQPIYFRVLIK